MVDLVRSNDEGQLGFWKDVRRTNVALTRAKRQRILVVNAQTLSAHPYYRALIAAAKQDGCFIRLPKA